ncbi:MAG: hypothetical protein Unbinned96contig1001_44 [Prokaryotic dsDNA virus sp.]|nr:MAG: hypothetical protein Unbinned96contig1001_44 [Prokaryotic dsDNA virus sp.]|tara:strand:- start:1304 stop:2059 length:756 start_codon:yes stop_codon:yes gene_type:complete
MSESNPDLKETQEANQPVSQEEKKPLFSGVDSQGKERLFSDAEEAQQSWQSAQNFIKDKVDETKSLETRIQELEAQLNQSTKLEDALQQLKNKEETPVTDEQTPQTTETTPQVDVETLTAQITQQVMGQLTASQQQQVQAQNQTESIQAAQALYGDSYEEKLRQSAQEIGMSDEDIIKEAQSNPKRFKKLFGLDKQQPKTYSPSSSASGFNQQSSKPELKLNSGFSGKDKLHNHLGNLEALAKAKGLDIKF